MRLASYHDAVPSFGPASRRAKVQTNFRLDPELIDATREAATAAQMTMTDWVIDAIKEKLARDRGWTPGQDSGQAQ